MLSQKLQYPDVKIKWSNKYSLSYDKSGIWKDTHARLVVKLPTLYYQWYFVGQICTQLDNLKDTSFEVPFFFLFYFFLVVAFCHIFYAFIFYNQYSHTCFQTFSCFFIIFFFLFSFCYVFFLFSFSSNCYRISLNMAQNLIIQKPWFNLAIINIFTCQISCV